MKKGKKLKTESQELPKTKSYTQIVVNVKVEETPDTDELPGYETTQCEVVQEVMDPCCWNCCHKINDKVISQPIKYEQGVFTTLGYFCSHACIARYIIDSNDPSDVVFSRLSTLNLYVNQLNKTRGERITPAPPRLSLKMFGGDMDINEYRKNNIDYLTIMNIDPVVSCADISVKRLAYKKINNVDNKKEFKLYRRNKKTNTNDIYSSMNLISG